MKLNDRLLAVSQFVCPNDSVIDVGCDHAFLSIYLMEHHLAKKVIASDNKEGPLQQAEKNIKMHHLEDKIKVQLSDGIKKIDEDTDTIVISGMGGYLMIGICKYLPDTLKQIKTVILSPNSDVASVRREFVKMGYFIDKELLVEEKGIIYPILRFQKGYKHYTKEDYLLGPLLRHEKNPLFMELNEREIKQKELLLSLLPKKNWMKKWKIKKELKCRKTYQ